MRHFGDWDGADGGLSAAIAASFPFKQREDEQELLATGSNGWTYSAI
jgi:hypothetical protein